MTKYNILIVDDEPTQCKVMSKFIEKLNHNYVVMNNGMDVIDFFVNKKIVNNLSYGDIDVVLLDLSMPDIDGLSVLKQIAPVKGDIQVIVLTASTDVTLAVKAINYCAIDYIVKGEKDVFARVSASISNAIEKKNLKYQVSHLARKGKNQVSFSDIIGHSESIISAINLGKKASNSNIPVLIEGPQGSGKELLARAIHGSSPRSGKPFIVVDCDLLKISNAEEELFGSERVSPEGNVKNIGKFREANGGTILLKKVDSLKLDLQIKLLRFMQEGEFIPPHGSTSVKVNIRIISSINRDLKDLIEQKKFREDVYYRISAFPIKIPSLKARGDEDIRLLAESFCRDFSINENKKIKTISQNALSLIYSFIWEDNVRQLKNAIFRAVVLSDEDSLKTEHFPQLLNNEVSSLVKVNSEFKKKSDINSELVDIFDQDGNCKTLDILEEEIIRRAMEVYSNNLSEVAKQLSIGRSTIYRKLNLGEEK